MRESAPRFLRAVVVLVAWSFASLAFAQDLAAIPPLTARVTDSGSLLAPIDAPSRRNLKPCRSCARDKIICLCALLSMASRRG